jgi:hypothetical protein
MATYTDTIGVSGVHGGSLYPNGGDYATLALWESASAASVTSGNVYEAVLLDGPAHDWTSGWPPWAEGTDLDYEIVVRGDNSHEGYWTSADRGTSGGATITPTNNISWNNFGDQNIKITFRDLIYSSTNTYTLYYGNFNVTSGYSGDYSTVLTWDRCMFIHDSALGSPPPFFNFRTGYESRDPVTGNVSAIGKFTINLINCVFESSTGFLWRMFPNNIAGEQNIELELNHIGCTWQQSSNTTSTNYGGRLAPVEGSRNDDAVDSILRINLSGCVSDGYPILGGDANAYFASAAKYCNMTDCLFEVTEASFKSNLGDWRSSSVYEKFIFTSSNITWGTSVGYTGASAPNTVSFEETDVNSVERNYRQVAGSLGVDYVSNSTMPSVDVTNTSRGTSPFTAGAYEFISATSDVTIDFGNTYIRVY